MSLLDQLQKDLVAAMKAREEARLSALRMIKTALQKAHADAAKPLDDPAEQGRAKMADVAALYGYTDQSHLIRDFKRFAHELPAQPAG